MPTTYQRKPPVTCFNCGDSMIKRRTSKTGRYYCQKPECQAERHKDWQADRSDTRVRELQDQIDEINRSTAAFITDALAGSATCPECGLMNAPLGWKHPTINDRPCDGLGSYNGQTTAPIVFAMFPADRRTYENR